jgi:hypothetical protein
LIAVALLALIVFLLFGALLEMYKDVRQLRDAVGILDRPLTVDIGRVAGTTPSSYGLPQAIDAAPSAIVLFLSERCATCHSLARGLLRPLPGGLWVVVEARDHSSAASFLDSSGLSGTSLSEQVVVDVAGEIARRIGLNTTPVGFRVERGLLTQATTVPSSRYLTSILPEPVRLRQTI